MIKVVATAALLLCACSGEPCPELVTDRAQQWALFKECLAAVPEGPQRTHYNDWDEVLEECRSIAREHSSRWVPSKVRRCWGMFQW